MKRLLKVTAMTGLLTLLRMAMGFVIAKVVAIYTGPTGLAMLGQVQSMITSFSGIINAPVGSGIVRYTAENKDQGFEACVTWWRASVQWIMIISTIVIPPSLLLSGKISEWLFQDDKLSWVVITTASTLPLVAIGTLCNSVINGLQLYRRYVIFGLVSTLLSGAVMIVMICFYHIQGALLAAAIQSALIGIIMLIGNLREPWFRLSYWWGAIEPKARKQIGGYMLMAVTTAFTVPISIILVRSILVEQVGWEAAGHWQAVWKISEVYLGVITMALGTYFLPRLASLVGVDAISKEINSTAKVIVPIIITISFIVYLMRDVAIGLLFTEEFRPARELFSIQLSGDIFKVIAWLYAYPMLSRGATKWFVSSEVIFSVSFVALAYVFILKLGVEGACFAYMINYILYLSYILINYKKFSK
ncbi:O-antigen translocase [Aeromonas veronii]|uniref:O-antigen translocase n=1 Tax=Aeromonas TaxID=642 RepID=UPI0013179E5A|nr:MULTISPECIES: O-antigen translocase [Aeromonas]MCF5844724.1 O-antigen translocase [Aeromonas veronii]QHB81916.1 O-antigen flippase [Aeromonas veronii]HDX8364206.1 O-antigen translocase [Aeromonas veronii]